MTIWTTNCRPAPTRMSWQTVSRLYMMISTDVSHSLFMICRQTPTDRQDGFALLPVHANDDSTQWVHVYVLILVSCPRIRYVSNLGTHECDSNPYWNKSDLFHIKSKNSIWVTSTWHVNGASAFLAGQPKLHSAGSGAQVGEWTWHLFSFFNSQICSGYCASQYYI